MVGRRERAHAHRGGGRKTGARWSGEVNSACAVSRVDAQLTGDGRAHFEHVRHVSDAGRVPVGDVLVELSLFEELSHVCDDRDVPIGDGAVLRNGGLFVCVVLFDRRSQL